MRFANEFDIDTFLRVFDDGSTPNLFRGAVVLNNLADWANDNSDGWAYWPKPCRSANRLIEILEISQKAWFTGGFITDITEADLRMVLRPIKAFLTRCGVDHAASEIFPN